VASRCELAFLTAELQELKDVLRKNFAANSSASVEAVGPLGMNIISRGADPSLNRLRGERLGEELAAIR
jgi:hypothetical protein